MSILFLFLTIIFIINGVFTNIFANKLEGYLDQLLDRDNSFWTSNFRMFLFLGLFLVTSAPLGYLTYLEFNPNQSGVPTSPDYYFWILFLPLIIFLIIILRDFDLLRRPSVLIVTVITVIVVVGGLYNRRVVLRETRTVYFLVDASDETKPYLRSDILAGMKLTALTIPNRVNLALAAFGVGLEGAGSCKDVTEFVRPSPPETAILEIENVLTLLDQYQPRSISGVQEAIEFAITQLKEQKGIHQIVVMTTGSDERCQALDRDSLNQQAEMLGVSFELVIIDLDEFTNEDTETFGSEADRSFTVSADNREEELSNIIQEIIDIPPAVYRSNYYD